MHGSVFGLWLKHMNREPRLALMLLLLLVGGTPLVLAGLSLTHVVPFLSDGVTVDGAVVTKRRGAPGGHGRRPHLILYEFVDAAGNRHQREDRAPVADWSAAQPGGAIAIRHIRGAPGRNRPEGIVWQDFRELLPLAALGFAITAGAIWAGVTGICRVRRKVRIDCLRDARCERSHAAGDDSSLG